MGQPSKKPQDHKAKKTKKKVTPASEWKKDRPAENAGATLELPSGNVCIARILGMEQIVKLGLIPNSLMAIVNKALETGDDEFEGLNLQDLLGPGDDGMGKLGELITMIDRVVGLVVVEPRILPVYLPVDDTHPPEREGETTYFLVPEDRDPDELYVDDLSFDDRLYLYTWTVGGTSDLEAFRQQPGTSLDAVPAGEDLAMPAE